MADKVSPKQTEKEVNFADVELVPQRPLSTHLPKIPITYPKSIIKKVSVGGPTTSVKGESTQTPPSKDELCFSPIPPPPPPPVNKPNWGSDAPEEKPKRGVLDSVESITLESDLESEADFFRKLTKKDTTMESDCAEESILSHDDDDDDFKVHFVHHGKKAENNMNLQSDLMFQINELQEAVIAMKTSLTEAVTKLSLVEGSSPITEVEEMRKKCDGNSAEILKMVLALKTEFSSLRNEVTNISKRQEMLQKSLCLMLEDRRVLAIDLAQAGVISQQTKTRLDNFNGALVTGGNSGSGSHSNDSGVALLLEKTSSSFPEDAAALQLSGNRISDQDSLPDQPALLVPASVYDYVASLSNPNSSLSSNNTTNQFFCQDSLPVSHNDPPLRVKEEGETQCDQEDICVTYDSDSSLTIAANKTISLSTCISQEIRVNDAFSSLPSTSSPERSGNKRHIRGDSDGSANASGGRERNPSQSRRRRPILGVSSAKMHLSTSQFHSSSGDKEPRLRHRYVSKGDPRETQRYRLAKELVETEKQYCRTLWTIQDVFAEPLKKAEILSNQDISTLFPEEVYLLYEKHCLLQHQLKERLASWKWQPLIGDILSRFTDPHQCEVLRLYTSYVNDFPEVLKTFHKLCHSSQTFTDFIKKSLDQPACRGLDLGAFLLTPVQRVPKYILLLKQLLKYTNSTHPDYRLINTVLERLRDFLSRLNDAMEHSFRLVNSTMSPSLSSVGELTVSSSPSKYKTGRTTRKSGLSREQQPGGSPSQRRNRHARIYQPSSSNVEGYRSPKRSTSSAGGPASPLRSPSKHMMAERSSSLPRGFTSMSSDSPDSSGDGQEESSSPERKVNRSSSRPESAIRYRSPHEATPYHYRTKYASLTPARSVTNMSTGEELRTTWEELTSSEPSLIEKSKLSNAKSLVSKKTPSLTSAHNISHTSICTANTHKLVTWTDSVESIDEKNKKKPSIKSSIKNIFTFKKRTNGQRNSRDEPLYWPSSVILETSAEGSPTHQYGTSSGASAPKQTPPAPSNVPIGDFLDEEGNPCSNV